LRLASLVYLEGSRTGGCARIERSVINPRTEWPLSGYYL
jgi:hypothetical protein